MPMLHVVPRLAGENKAQRERTVYAKQLLLGRYLDPWASPDIVWCHSHTIVRGLKVILNVYDLLPPRLNGFLAAVRMGGAFHSGVQVGPTEYAFGGHTNDDLGITALRKPLFALRTEAEEAVRQGQDGDGNAIANLEWMPKLRSRTVVGWWMGPVSELEWLLRGLRFEDLWVGSEYRLLSRNCNHFSRAMCAALLGHPLFKPAPGCTRPEQLVPPAVTRLPALVLALGCCAPCIVRRLNAPIPLSPDQLNTFQGQARKAGPEPSQLRVPSRYYAAPRTQRTASVPLTASSSASAGGGGDTTGVRQSPSSALHANGGSGTVPTRRSSGAVAPAAAAAAAADDGGRLLRPRLQGQYQSLNIETAAPWRGSADRPLLRNALRRRAEDGGGGGAGGPDSTADTNTECSTPDLDAAAAATTATTNVHRRSHSPQAPRPELAAFSPFVSTAATVATASEGQVTAVDGAAVNTTAYAATTAAVAVPGTASSTPMLSVTLPPPMAVLEAATGAAPCASTVIAASAATSTAFQRSPTPRYLCSSRSGRRVFPDPRVAPPAHGGAGSGACDAALDSITALSTDGGAGGVGIGARTSDGSLLRDRFRVDFDFDLGPMAPAREAEAGPEAMATAAAVAAQRQPAGSGAGCCPRQPPHSPLTRSMQTQPHPQLHPFLSPRSSTNGGGGGLPPLLQPPAAALPPRVDGTPVKSPPAPLPPALAQLPLQNHQQQPSTPSTPISRSAAATADGSPGAAAAASGAGGGVQHSPSEPPRPWSVLSGGFVDLLFSPSVAEPPPGVPHPGTVSGTVSGGGPNGGRRYSSSCTGDGAGVFSAASNAFGGAAGGGFGLEPVASGDLSDSPPLSPGRRGSSLRARAATAVLGAAALGGGEEAAGGGGGGAAAAAATLSGMGAAAAAAASPLARPAGSGNRVVVRTGTGQGTGTASHTAALLPPPAVSAGAVAVVAAEGTGTASPSGWRGGH